MSFFKKKTKLSPMDLQDQSWNLSIEKEDFYEIEELIWLETLTVAEYLDSLESDVEQWIIDMLIELRNLTKD